MPDNWSRTILKTFFSKSGHGHYEPLRHSEGNLEEPKNEAIPARKRASLTVIVVVLFLAAIITSGTTGFFLGIHNSRSSKDQAKG